MGSLTLGGRLFDSRAVQQLLVHSLLMAGLPLISYYAVRNFYITHFLYIGWDPEFVGAGGALTTVQLIIARFVYIAVTEEDEEEDVKEKEEYYKRKESVRTRGVEDIVQELIMTEKTCKEMEAKNIGKVMSGKLDDTNQEQSVEVEQVVAQEHMLEEEKEVFEKKEIKDISKVMSEKLNDIDQKKYVEVEVITTQEHALEEEKEFCEEKETKEIDKTMSEKLDGIDQEKRVEVEEITTQEHPLEGEKKKQ